MIPVEDPGRLPRRLRSRERVLAGGAQGLSAAELLALVLAGGRESSSAWRTAARLLSRHDLARMGARSAAEWRLDDGLPAAAAVRLATAFELGRRSRHEVRARRARLARPQDAYRHVSYLGTASKEHLVGLYLDAQNGLLTRETISIGSLNTTRTHPREILYPAVTHLALGFILAHNHPSGSTDPSPEDLEFTRSIRAAGEMMGIELYDHLIVAGDDYLSLRERGLL